MPELYDHQKASVAFHADNPLVFDMSDAGTGKTASTLIAAQSAMEKTGLLGLIIAPKSILRAAWARDAAIFTPDLRVSVANAVNREKAFAASADLYITNHDATNWLAKQSPKFFNRFGHLAVDESTAFKNRMAERSKALNRIVNYFEIRNLLSATPSPNTILDIWHQMFLLDRGQRLGDNFYKFRAATCTPIHQNGAPGPKWVDNDGIQEVVGSLIADICIRHSRDSCLSLPDHTIRELRIPLSPSTMRQYRTLEKRCRLELAEGTLSIPHRATLRNKLLQLISGAVYDSDPNKPPHHISNERTEFVLDLVEEVSHSVVAFTWTHQRDQLIAEANRRGLSYTLIDGSVSDRGRLEAVERFQAGEARVMFAHPQAASHGLTLTRGVRTIWAAPCGRTELFSQFNHRIFRAGQIHKTETIYVTAEDTLEPAAYLIDLGHLDAMTSLLDLLEYQCPPQALPTSDSLYSSISDSQEPLTPLSKASSPEQPTPTG